MSRPDGRDALLPLPRGWDSRTLRTIPAFRHNGREPDRILQIMQQICPAICRMPSAPGRRQCMHARLPHHESRQLTDDLGWVCGLPDAPVPGRRRHE